MKKEYKHKVLNYIASCPNDTQYWVFHQNTHKFNIARELVENSYDWEEIISFKINDWIHIQHTVLKPYQRLIEQHAFNTEFWMIRDAYGVTTSIDISKAVHAERSDVFNYLISIAHDKNFLPGQVCNDLNSNNFVVSSEDNFKYDFDIDTLYCDKNPIYQQGKWAIVYKDKRSLKFGNVEFKLNSDNTFETKHGIVTLEEINKAIEYIQNPPKLASYSLTIHDSFDYCSLANSSFGFGCCKGELAELIAIRDMANNIPDEKVAILRTDLNHTWLNQFINTKYKRAWLAHSSRAFIHIPFESDAKSASSLLQSGYRLLSDKEFKAKFSIS